MSLLSETLPNLSLARPGLPRAADRRLEPGLVADLLADPATRVVEVRGDRVEVEVAQLTASPTLALRPPRDTDSVAQAVFLGVDGDSTAYVGVWGEADEGEAASWRTLRQVGADLGDRDAGLFTTILALANWHRAHTHCPRCGAPTEPVQAGWLRRCERDGTEHYPRTDVAVIVSVIDDDDRILLARGAQWPEGRFSILAGFLEPGESLAAAVAREVEEEVGVPVREVEYLGDQPWPFPSSIMVGFTARTSTTVLRLQDAEIAEARWFTRDEYRRLLVEGGVSASTRLSIARRIIERWLGQDLDTVVGPTA